MSPSHSRHSAPAMSDDDIMSVFLRIPPDDPACLVRASLVCKAWRRILTGPDFCRLYREFHGTPPMLGFVVSFWSRSRDSHNLVTGDSTFVSQFIPTTAFRLSAGPDFYPHNWKAMDSRHGRILVELVDEDGLAPSGYIVWDPITNGRWGVPIPRINLHSWTGAVGGAVLCAKEQCDHLGCHGLPFLVAMVASNQGTTSACVYSSESGVWSDIITLEHWDGIDGEGRSILVGNTLYFPFAQSYSILLYKLGEQKLSVIDVPQADWIEPLVFISAEDDVLVFAGFRGTILSLWSAEAGALAWAKRTVIDLEKLLPPRAFQPKPRPPEDESESNSESDSEDQYKPYVSGYVEGAVFLSTMAGLFTVELCSGRIKKVSDVQMSLHVIPWISFYSQDHARLLMPRL